MQLIGCRLCGKVFTNGGRNNICPQCISRLGELYNSVHEYIRDHEDEEFDVDELADAMGINAVDVQALVDLGYLERDLSLYGKRETARSKMAHAFSTELDRMRKNKITTYGGDVYARSYDRDNDDTARKVRQR